MTILTFILFQLMFLGVGLSAILKKRSDTEDYLVAGRAVHPVLMAMAAASTNSSGFMFIGLIGETYRQGLSSAWLMAGWICGDYIAWRVIHRPMRERSAEVGAQSIPTFLSSSPTGIMRPVRMIAALLTLVFLGTYAAAQLTAGSKALQVLFDWPQVTGAVMGAAMIAAYCFAGGIRASIWTNTAQAVVMIVSMFVLLVAALSEIGGWDALWSRLREIDPQLVDWRPRELRFGIFLFLLSWLMAGVGVIGQPHLMTIAMSIDSADRIRQARPWYFVWYVAFSAACILVGLSCRVLLDVPNGAGFDQELALPMLSLKLLPPVFIGLILSGLFAATISTADTQILCCSAAITQDLFPWAGRTYAGAKAGTMLVTAAVLLIALFGSHDVFHLVVMSWSALASALGPLLAVQALRQPVNAKVGCTMMLGGLTAAMTWRYVLHYSDSAYEVLPGMATGFAIYFGMRLFASTLNQSANASANEQ